MTEKFFHFQSNSSDHAEQQILNLDFKALYKEAFDPKSNQYSHCVQLRSTLLCQEYGTLGSEICMSLRSASVCI